MWIAKGALSTVWTVLVFIKFCISAVVPTEEEHVRSRELAVCALFHYFSLLSSCLRLHRHRKTEISVHDFITEQVDAWGKIGATFASHLLRIISMSILFFVSAHIALARPYVYCKHAWRMLRYCSLNGVKWQCICERKFSYCLFNI